MHVAPSVQAALLGFLERVILSRASGHRKSELGQAFSVCV